MRSANGTTGPQHILRVRVARAEAYWLDGRPAEARREAELADDVSAGADDWERGLIAAGCGGRAPPARPAVCWPVPTGSRPAATGSRPRASGPSWDAGTRPGLALLESGQETALRDALRIFTDLGAVAAVGVTRQLMRQLGVRSIPAGPRSATRAHPLGLTRREQEVLGLICAGHTNAEIAGQLFISAKTVDHHVSAVLAKLGAPSREVAASEAARLGLAGTASV